MRAAYGRGTIGMLGYDGFSSNCERNEITVSIAMMPRVVKKTTITDHPWSPSQDKALKIDVVRADGNAITLAMREWLQHYNAPQQPLPPRPPQYHQQRLADLYARLTEKQQKSKRQVDIIPSHRTPPPILAHKHYDKKRAALYGRLARRRQRQIQLVELDNLRKRAMAASARHWPPSRSQPHHPDNIALEAARRREDAERAAEEEARRAAQATQRRAEVEERVALLVERREAGRRRLGKFFL
ncbi:hypothetical protein R3P38DRAFT_3239326 [Favolaschia claudopus]|uniref:Uncharacterized protein n=1 Tax=Favolaschia claudopus TaxID=2862362 RepID=A0AAV9Z9U5_9AGAR